MGFVDDEKRLADPLQLILFSVDVNIRQQFSVVNISLEYVLENSEGPLLLRIGIFGTNPILIKKVQEMQPPKKDLNNKHKM